MMMFHQFGDKAHFALEVRLWEDPDGEGAAPWSSVGSWGQWRLWVGGLNLCEHELCAEDGSVVFQTETTWYLAPLMRWLATQWGPLLHEERLPSLGRSNEHSARDAYLNRWATIGDDLDQFAPWQDWATRHSLRCAAEGGLFPDIFMRRVGDEIEVSWGDRRRPGAEALSSKLEPGLAHAEVGVVALVLDQALTWFARQPALQARPWFEAFSAALNDRCSVQQRAGWWAWWCDGAATPGPLTILLQRLRAQGRAAWERLFDGEDAAALALAPLSPAAAMFGALSPQISDEAVVRLMGVAAESLAVGEGDEAALDRFGADAPAWRARSPWDQGYRLAQEVLDVAGADQAATPSLPALLAQIGVRRIDEPLGAEGPRGVALAGGGLAPTIIVNSDDRRNKWPKGQRFTVAHELCHILFDRGRARRVTHTSTAWAPAAVEQRANAFASWLLMSPPALRRIMPVGAITLTAMFDAADQLDVGVRALINHLANLGEISGDAQDQLLSELEER